jgi:hypothetical protein
MQPLQHLLQVIEERPFCKSTVRVYIHAGLIFQVFCLPEISTFAGRISYGRYMRFLF